MSWEKLKLEEIGLITSGGTPSTGNPAYWNGEIPWITPKDLSNFENRYIENGERNITDEGLKNSSAKLVKEKSVLLSSRAPIGYLAIAQNDLTTNQGFKNITPNEKCDYLYLFYCLKNNVEYLKSLGIGATYPELSSSRLKEIQIPVPSLPTQRKIATILSAYDDLIENNLKRIKLLEEKTQLHYKIEFGEYQFGDKEPQNLPKGWAIKTIGDIYGKLESGSRPKGGIDKELKEGIASVGAENVIGLGKYNYQSEKLITEAFFENMNRGKIENKDILIYKDGAYIGKTTLFQDDFPHEKCCVNEHVFLLRSKDDLYQNYLFFTLYQKLYFDKMQQLNANAAQPGINQESLKSLRILWPSENVIEEFNKKVESLMKLIFVVAKQNTKLREARDILLPKLMNGQIEV